VLAFILQVDVVKWTGLAGFVYLIVSFGKQAPALVPVEVPKSVETHWTCFFLQLYCLIKRCCVKSLVKSSVKSCKKPCTIFCS